MLAVLSDTHADAAPSLTPHLEEVVQRTDGLIHAGDFTTEAALDGFERVADDLFAVAGNRDSAAIRDRLPAQRVVERFGRRLLVVHGHQHSATALHLLARQEEADVAIVGHSHRPTIEREGDLILLNPGSHADPRRYRPGYAVVEDAGSGVRVRLRSVSGDDIRSVSV